MHLARSRTKKFHASVFAVDGGGDAIGQEVRLRDDIGVREGAVRAFQVDGVQASVSPARAHMNFFPPPSAWTGEAMYFVRKYGCGMGSGVGKVQCAHFTGRELTRRSSDSPSFLRSSAGTISPHFRTLQGVYA